MWRFLAAAAYDACAFLVASLNHFVPARCRYSSRSVDQLEGAEELCAKLAGSATGDLLPGTALTAATLEKREMGGATAGEELASEAGLGQGVATQVAGAVADAVGDAMRTLLWRLV